MDFEFLSGALGILFGLFIIIFRSKYVSLQKRQAGIIRTPWSKEIIDKDTSEMERASLIVGFGFIVIGLAMLASWHGLI